MICDDDTYRILDQIQQISYLYIILAILRTDIENAFSSGSYPKRLSYKLHLRKGFCLKELGQPGEAEKALSAAEDLVILGELEPDKLREVGEMIAEARQKLGERPGGGAERPPDSETLERVEHPHPLLPELRTSLQCPLPGRAVLRNSTNLPQFITFHIPIL